MGGFDKALVQCLMVGGIGWLTYLTTYATMGKQTAKIVKTMSILIMVNIGAPVVWNGIVSVRDYVNSVTSGITYYADRFLDVVEAPGQMADGVKGAAESTKDFLTRMPDQEAGREAVEKYLLEAPNKEAFWEAVRKFFFESPKNWR